MSKKEYNFNHNPALGIHQGKDLSEPINLFSFCTDESDLPARLDSFLAKKMPWRSRRFFQKMIRKKQVTVDGKFTKSGKPLFLNEKIDVDVSEYQVDYNAQLELELNIIYEDDDLLVLNKPAGVIVHPTGWHLYDTLINVVHARYKNCKYKPKLVHRLDRDTSGVLVLVKSEKNRAILAKQIENREVKKIYKAITHRIFNERQGDIILPIFDAIYSHIRLKQGIVPNGLPSHTRYTVEATAPYVSGLLNGLSYVTLDLLTGRTHQIRVHLSAIGHPIIADKLYGYEKKCYVNEIMIDSHLLHAWKFRCKHPRTEESMEFEAALPNQFSSCLKTVFGFDK